MRLPVKGSTSTQAQTSQRYPWTLWTSTRLAEERALTCSFRGLPGMQ